MTQANFLDHKLLGPTVFTPKALIKHVGRTPASVLQQLHYALKKSKFTQYGQSWVCRTQEDWAEIMHCSVSTIVRAFNRLESMGLVVARRLHKHMYNQLKSYRVDYEALSQLLELSNCQDQTNQSDRIDPVTLTSSITENLKTRSLKKQQTVESQVEVESASPPTQPVQRPRVDKKGSLTPTDTDNNSEKQETEKIKAKVKVKEQKQACEQEQEWEQEQEKTINPELEKEIVETVGHKISANLKQLIAQTKLDIVLDALKVVKHTIQNKTCKNPAGLLTTAIRREWKPSAANLSSDKNVVLDPDFSEWFDTAKGLGLVMGSEFKGGQLWIYASPDGQPQLYEDIRAMFSMSWLKKKMSARSLGLKMDPI